MLLLAISVLVLLATANYWLERRIFYPPVVFCAVWAVNLAIVGLSGDLFFSLSEKTLSIFCCGAIAFSIGSCCALILPERVRTRNTTLKTSDKILSLLVVGILCATPFVYMWIQNLASQFQSAPMLMAARMAMLDLYSTDSHDLLMPFLIVLSVMAAMMAFAEGGKARAWIAISAALGLTLLTGGRSASISLILSLICIDYIKNGRARWQILVATAAGILIIFGAMAIFVQNGQARADAPFSENVKPVLETLALYTCGGPVGFDRVVRSPNIIPHEWQVTAFFVDTANKLGARLPVSTRHADFLAVGPNLQGNVYTMYFAYLDLGYAGMMALILCLGFGITLFYIKAIGGGKVALMIYSYLFAAIVLSPFADEVFMELNFLLKLFAVAWVVYCLPLRMKQFLNILRRTSSSESSVRPA